MPALKLLKGPATRDWFPLESSSLLIGRDQNESDVWLEPEEVSRKHAKIVSKADGCYIFDLKSRNHTYVNSTRLQPGQGQKLQHGDLIKICSIVLRFTTEDDSRSTFTASQDKVHYVSADDSSSAEFSSLLDSSSGSWNMRTSRNTEAKLRAMMQIARELHAALALDEVLARVLDCLLSIFPQANYALVLLTATKDEPERRVVKYRRDETDESVFVSQVVIDHVTKTSSSIISDDLKLDPRFSMSQSISESAQRSIMCAPLIDMGGESLGAIQLDAKQRQNQFTNEDLDLLASVALQISLSVVDSRLHESVVREREMQRDLELAREIQLGLLPSESPVVEGYEFYDFYLPAKYVGGDFYDYIKLPDGRLAIVIGDVAGKGIPAAILMAKLSSELRVRLATGESPAKVFQQLTSSFSVRSPQWRFVTALLAVLDVDKHELRVTNAGHMRPLRRRADGSVAELGANESGLPIGIFADHEYQEACFSIEPGDLFMLYSDGVSDSQNDLMKTLNISGVTDHLLHTSQTEAISFGNSMIDRIREFTGGHQQTDDICLLCLSRKAVPAKR